MQLLIWTYYISQDNLLGDVITVEYLIDVQSKFEMEFYAAFLVFKGLHIIIKKSKVYSEPSQKSEMELLAEKLNGSLFSQNFPS